MRVGVCVRACSNSYVTTICVSEIECGLHVVRDPGPVPI